MEGVASEAASLAGHLQLGNLIVVCSLSDSWAHILTELYDRYMMTIVRHCSFPVFLKRTLYLDISIDGDTAVAFTENVEQRFLAYGWQVLSVENGDR